MTENRLSQALLAYIREVSSDQSFDANLANARPDSQASFEELLSAAVMGVDRIKTAYQEMLKVVRQPAIERLQLALDHFRGSDFGTLETKKAVARAVQTLLIDLELRVKCPTCGEPAYLRCSLAGNTRPGTFQFQHARKGRQTHHGGAKKFPGLKLISVAKEQ